MTASLVKDDNSIFRIRKHMDVVLRYALVAILLCSATASCRGPDTSIELLESELRWMEDQLYVLDQELAYTQAKLKSSQRYNRALKDELSRSRSPDENGSAADDRSDAGGRRPRIEEIPFDESDLQVPRVDLGPLPDDEEIGEPPQRNPAESFDDPDPTMHPELDALDDVTRGNANLRRIARIVLNRQLTGGYDFDGHPGDEGLMVVIEPQNAAGQYVPMPGELYVSAQDPSVEREAGRIATWEFTAVESMDLLRKTLLGRGFHLHLPWPDEPPKNQDVSLVVRYRAAGGESLEASRTIDVELESPAVSNTANKRTAFPLGANMGGTIEPDAHVTSLPPPPVAPDPAARSSGREGVRNRTESVRTRSRSIRETRTPAWSPQR